MNSQGLQQGQYRGLWFEEDVMLLDLYELYEKQGRRLIATIDLTGEDISKDMREVIDANWWRVRRTRENRLVQALDAIPWEIHDIDDPKARYIAMSAYLNSRV